MKGLRHRGCLNFLCLSVTLPCSLKSLQVLTLYVTLELEDGTSLHITFRSGISAPSYSCLRATSSTEVWALPARAKYLLIPRKLEVSYLPSPTISVGMWLPGVGNRFKGKILQILFTFRGFFLVCFSVPLRSQHDYKERAALP